MPAEFPGGAWWPERRTWPPSSHAPINNPTGVYAITDTGRLKMGVVFEAPHTGHLTGFGVTLGAIGEFTGGVDPEDVSIYEFSIQGVDATTGVPDGTGQVTHTCTYWDWTSYTWYRADMSAPYAVTRGDLVACTVARVQTGISASATWPSLQQPQQFLGPPWQVYVYLWDGVGSPDWLKTSHAPYMPAGFVLFYAEAGLSGPPGHDQMPLAVLSRSSSPMASTGPVGMHFTVPTLLRCDGLALHFRPNADTTLSLYEQDVLLHAETIAASADFGYFSLTFPEIVLRPGRAYRAELTAVTPFQIHGYKTVSPPAGASIPGAPGGIPATWPGLDGMLDDFEGGPTWTAYGDPAADWYAPWWSDAPPLTDRWYFSLHILGPALAGSMGGIAGCSTTFTPEPCDPTCPPDPPGLTPEAVEIAAAFTAALWFLGLGSAPAPGAVAAISGCGGLTFVNELCGGLAAPSADPGLEGCAAPLGLFVLGETCLGPLEVSPTAARRVPRRWSHAHAH